MIDKAFLDKYPRTKAFLEKTGFTLEQAFIWVEQELEKRVP